MRICGLSRKRNDLQRLSETLQKCLWGGRNHAKIPVVSAPSALDVLSLQNPSPAQCPQIYISKTSEAIRTKKLVSVLKEREKVTDRAGSSKD